MRRPPLLDAFKAWLEAFGDAWEATDAQAMAELFAPGASMQPNPFAELIRGGRSIVDFWRAELEDEHDVRFVAQVLGAGDTYGLAQWRVSYSPTATGPRKLRDGILVSALDSRGRCSSLRLWWHESEERAADLS